MDNRLQILSWLMLLAMLSMMAVQTVQGGDEENTPVASLETFRPLPSFMAMSYAPPED